MISLKGILHMIGLFLLGVLAFWMVLAVTGDANRLQAKVYADSIKTLESRIYTPELECDETSYPIWLEGYNWVRAVYMVTDDRARIDERTGQCYMIIKGERTFLMNCEE